MAKHAKSLEKEILARMKGNGDRWVFTPGDFPDLGGRVSILSAIFRMKKDGLLRQLARGLYDRPQVHPTLGVLAATPDAVAAALARRDTVRVQASGAYAANLLGISEQVPMKIVFLTDGRARKVQVGRQQIILRHTTPRNMATAGRISGLVIQALRFTGKRYVTDDVVRRLSSRLDDNDRKQILADAKYAPAWIAAIMRRLGAGAKVTR
jgi:hypothetical protein